MYLKLMITQLLLLLGVSVYSQVGYAIVTPNSQGVVHLYEKPISQNIVDSIINDSINEVYYCVSIIKFTRNRAFVSTFTDDETLTMHRGWVDWKYLGIRLNNDTIFTRHKPSSKSKVWCVIYQPNWRDIYPINHARNGWLYIMDKNRNITGWVAPKDQCSNPYTTCH